MTEREFLRIHVEACWGISVPPLVSTAAELSAASALPPWSLYYAQLPREEVTVWRPDVAPEQRPGLLEQARGAGRAFDAATGMRREVVLLQPTDVSTSVATSYMPCTPDSKTSPIIRLLADDDAVRLEAFEAGSAMYYLSPERAPCIGVLVDGRLVTVAHSSRRTSLACALGIDTIPEARRRGYATMATIAWTQAMRQERLLPIYSARADNAASLGVAAAAGYVPVFEGVYGPVGETNG